MKSWVIIILCYAAIAWTPAHAQVRCGIVRTMATLHDAQIRLRDYPDAIVNEITWDSMRAARAGLNVANVRNALGSDMTAHDYAQVARFLEVSDQVISDIREGNAVAARRFLGQPANMQMNREVATILRTLPCAGVNTAEPPPKTTDQIAGLRAFLAKAPPIWLVLLIFATGTGIVMYLRHRAGQRRRGRRYGANYVTQYECSDGTATGTLLDISCSGAKLRHDADLPAEIGAQILVEIEGEKMSANVVWQNQHYTGLRFETLLPIATVMQVHQFREGHTPVPA